MENWQKTDPGNWLPHTGDMIMIHEVLFKTEHACRCRTDVNRLVHFRRTHGRIPAWAGIEIMAQTSAAQDGILSHERGMAPRIGFLVSTRSYTCHTPYFLPGWQLITDAEREYGSDHGMIILACRIKNLQDGALLAEAKINLYVPENQSEFELPHSPA